MSSQTIEYFIAIIKSAKELSGKEKEILAKRLQGGSINAFWLGIDNILFLL